MRKFKRDEVTFIPVQSPLTVQEIASLVRIIAGQTLVIQQEDKTLAEYRTCTEVGCDKDNQIMQLPVDLIGWIGKQMIIYVGGPAI